MDLSQSSRRRSAPGTEEQQLVGKEIALIFEKDSRRTRCAFEVAAYDGAHVTFMARAARTSATRRRSRTPRGCSGACTRERVPRVRQELADELAQSAGVRLQRPHRRVAPTQMFADFLDHSPAPSTSPTRRWRTAISAAPASTSPTATWRSGRSSAWTCDRGAQVAVACAGAGRHGKGFADAGAARGRSRGRGGGRAPAATSCSPTYGSPWESPTTSGPAHRAAHAIPDQHPYDGA